MFNFFNFYRYKLPSQYQNIISPKDYNLFIKRCIQLLKTKQIKVTKHDDGCLSYQLKDGSDASFYLDNLVRLYVQAPADEKINCIENHFNKLQDHSQAYQFLYKDFEYAKPYLKILIKHSSLSIIDEFIHRNDYPNLYTVLVFDFENQFHYIRKDEASAWNVGEQLLFEIAIENISNEPIEFGSILLAEKYTAYLLLNGDFSAASTLLIKDKFPEAIGSYGSIVALPTKGTVFICPVEAENAIQIIEVLYPEVGRIYEADAGIITTDFYWYYEGTFELFPTKINSDESISIFLPKTLKDLFQFDTDLLNPN